MGRSIIGRNIMGRRFFAIAFFGTIAAACLATTITACGDVAQDNPDARVAVLKDGQTSYSQVMQTMGKPYGDYGHPDGTRTVIYHLNQQQADSATHIPVIGPYAGSITPIENVVTLNFDKNGVLVSHSSVTRPAPANMNQ